MTTSHLPTPESYSHSYPHKRVPFLVVTYWRLSTSIVISSYRSGSGHVGPMTLSGQTVYPDLLSPRSDTLTGSADLGVAQIYSNLSLPQRTGQDMGLPQSPDPEYARIVRSRPRTNEDSRNEGLQPTMMQQSFSSNSDDQAEGVENTLNEVILQANRYHSGSHLDVSQILMHQSRLSASDLQVHSPAVENQPCVQQEGRRDAAIHQSVSDLIQLDGSTPSLSREDAALGPVSVMNQPHLRPASDRLSRSQDALHQLQHPVASATGCMNLAASMGSLNRSDINKITAASQQPSQTSIHCAGGHDNVALATDETPVVTHASRFAAYASSFGSDTVV